MEELDVTVTETLQLRVLLSSRGVREEPTSQRMLAGARGVTAAGPLRDSSLALFDMQNKRREEGELKTQIKERSQILESLQQRTDELHEKMKKARNLHLSFATFLKYEDTEKAAEKAEKERKEVLHLETKLERLKLVHAELMERKREQQRRIQRRSVYRDLMVRMVRMTKFDDVQELTGHIESLLYFQDHLLKRENKAHEQVDQLRKSLLTLEDNHRLLRLQKNNQLSQLQTEMEKMRSEALSWERKWNHIQETAAKKTLLLGRIKMATLNLYEMTDDVVEGDETVNMNDAEKQLDKVKMFIQDHEGMVKQRQTPSQKHDGQEKDKSKPKKHIATRTSQDASI